MLERGNDEIFADFASLECVSIWRGLSFVIPVQVGNQKNRDKPLRLDSSAFARMIFVHTNLKYALTPPLYPNAFP
jgi:hypothetical protein